MSIKAKLVLSNIAMLLVPLILFAITFFSIQSLYLTKIHNEYDIVQRRRGVIFTPYEIHAINLMRLGKISQDFAKYPDELNDKDLLRKTNDDLLKKNTFMILKKGKSIIFNGEKTKNKEVISKVEQSNNSEVISKVEQSDYKSSDKLGDFFMVSSELMGRQYSVRFSDGTEGSIFFIVDASRLISLYKEFLVELIISAILIISIMGGLLTFIVSRSILNPLKELKKGTENIKNGDLDSEVKAKSKDEIGNLCEAFDSMRKQLKKSIELQAQYENNRKELISNISHDLKTPITSIKGYVEGIKDGVADSPEKMEKYINTIYTKAQSMDYLIDELLTYSKLDLNKLPFDFKKVDIGNYMEDVMEELSLDVEKKNFKFSYTNKLPKKISVELDIQQIGRVLTNIISNSIKYMDKKNGKIDVEMKLDKDEVIIGVKDNGKGISKEALPYVFDRFYREDSSRNSMTGGSGLGLAICKKIIQEHGGRIWAESEEGVGTNMIFSIKIQNN
ncbi:sensor histidine kinase [Clostridium hydrogenum]|uniref:sensor histidine kinase n=1 Tax=Clostridium hydrogenum TaxID=2855764 RepID=UPI001F1DCEE5|nr:HAMP domain-containing sensor histidine kinase [Clostridium hydrogenum]